MYLFFSFLLDTLSFCTLVLWPFSDTKHCIYPWYIFDDVVIIFTYPFICCFFSLFIHMFLIYVCNLLFIFHTKMPWWVFFKVFQKDRLSKSSMPWTLFLQKFSRVCVRVEFIVFIKWLWVKWFMTSLIFHLLVVVLS